MATTIGCQGGPYNSATMLRRFLAVLILHFLLCVGFSAAGLNPAVFGAQGPEVTAQSAPGSPAAPGVLSDADDHALMDEKGDLPDQLEPHPLASAGAVHSVDSVPHPVNRSLSAVVDPPHKPPKISGSLA